MYIMSTTQYKYILWISSHKQQKKVWKCVSKHASLMKRKRTVSTTYHSKCLLKILTVLSEQQAYLATSLRRQLVWWRETNLLTLNTHIPFLNHWISSSMMVNEYLWHQILDVGTASTLVVHQSPNINCFDRLGVNVGKSQTVSRREIVSKSVFISSHCCVTGHDILFSALQKKNERLLSNFNTHISWEF